MVETVAYNITGTIGEIEFRDYPELVLASVNDSGDDSGFEHLFRYITGNNRTKGKLSMTSPVITSESIPMTAPVVSQGRSMSFVMPQGKAQSDLPDPLDSRVLLTTLPPREIAVIMFRGYAGKDDVDSASMRLREGLKRAGIKTREPVFLMRYNPPWTPGFLRRNEVGIEIIR